MTQVLCIPVLKGLNNFEESYTEYEHSVHFV